MNTRPKFERRKAGKEERWETGTFAHGSVLVHSLVCEAQHVWCCQAVISWVYLEMYSVLKKPMLRVTLARQTGRWCVLRTYGWGVRRNVMAKCRVMSLQRYRPEPTLCAPLTHCSVPRLPAPGELQRPCGGVEDERQTHFIRQQKRACEPSAAAAAEAEATAANLEHPQRSTAWDADIPTPGGACRPRSTGGSAPSPRPSPHQQSRPTCYQLRPNPASPSEAPPAPTCLRKQGLTKLGARSGLRHDRDTEGIVSSTVGYGTWLETV